MLYLDNAATTKINKEVLAAMIDAFDVYGGQATTQRLHPLQRSVFTTTAPFIFAIILVYLKSKCNTFLLRHQS